MISVWQNYTELYSFINNCLRASQTSSRHLSPCSLPYVEPIFSRLPVHGGRKRTRNNCILCFFTSLLTVSKRKKKICSNRILTCRIKSIRSPAKVGLVVTDLITSPVVSWEGWETPPPQHRGSAVILCSTTGVVRPLCSCGDLLLSSARLVYVLVDCDWNTFSSG